MHVSLCTTVIHNTAQKNVHRAVLPGRDIEMTEVRRRLSFSEADSPWLKHGTALTSHQTRVSQITATAANIESLTKQLPTVFFSS